MDSEKLYKIWLSYSVSANVVKKLIKYYGSAQAVWDNDIKLAYQSNIITVAGMNAILKGKQRFDAEDILKTLEKTNTRVITQDDEEFPEGLKDIKNSPYLLYVRGEKINKGSRFVSVVGSRGIDNYGARVCRDIVTELAKCGVVIVSGLAMGVDAAAHRAALDAGGKTIAVMATGIDRCYPQSNMGLYTDIIGSGCLMTEYELHSHAEQIRFPKRNRIVSGISEAVIVIQARRKSGSLITANYAIEQGRRLFTVPANIFDSRYEGSNNLLRKGARAITCFEDLKEDLNLNSGIGFEDKNEKNNKINKISLDSEQKKVYDCVDYDSVSVDEIAIKTGKSVREVSTLLTLLELNGLVTKLAGQRYVKNKL